MIRRHQLCFIKQRSQCAASSSATTALRSCSTSTAASTGDEPKKKTQNFQSYKAFENMDELRNKLMSEASEIQQEEHKERESLGVNSGQAFADPIWYDTHFGATWKKKKGDMQSYMNKDATHHWMRVQDAAKVLEIPKEKIPGLTKKTIEEKFTAAYQKAGSDQEKDFIVSSAELLLEYIDSAFAGDVSRAKKHQLIQEMREELDKENKAWHNQVFETMIYGVSGYVTTVITLTGFAIILIYIYTKAGALYGQDNNFTSKNFGNFVRKSVNYDPNLQDSPDYTNRYRDTPTSYEMMQKEGHMEIGDPMTRKTLLEEDAMQNKELAMLAMLLRDKDAIAEKAEEVVKNEGKRSEDPVGPRLLKEMMEKKIDAEWWENAKKLQTIYQESNVVSKW